MVWTSLCPNSIFFSTLNNWMISFSKHFRFLIVIFTCVRDRTAELVHSVLIPEDWQEQILSAFTNCNFLAQRVYALPLHIALQSLFSTINSSQRNPMHQWRAVVHLYTIVALYFTTQFNKAFVLFLGVSVTWLQKANWNLLSTCLKRACHDLGHRPRDLWRIEIDANLKFGNCCKKVYDRRHMET